MHSHSKFDLVFNIPGSDERVKLSLEPNRDIIPEGAGVKYLDAEGQEIGFEPFDRRQFRIFKGSSWTEGRDGSWINAGWSRITIVKDGERPVFEGAFSLWHDSHHIQLRSKYLRTKHELDAEITTSAPDPMVLWRDSDTIGTPTNKDLRRRDEELACTADKLSFNSDPLHPLYQGMTKREAATEPLGWGSMPFSSMLARRQIDTTPSGGNSGAANLNSTIGQSAGCPMTRKVALVGVVTDCGYSGIFANKSDTSSHVLSVYNQASEVYEKTFNITLGIANLTVSDAQCPGTPPSTTPWNIGCSSNTTITDRLNTFSTWRIPRSECLLDALDQLHYGSRGWSVLARAALRQPGHVRLQRELQWRKCCRYDEHGVAGHRP